MFLSKIQKLLERIRNNPKTVRFDELESILTSEGFKQRQPGGGSSHHIFKKGTITISVPYCTPYVKKEYVKQVIELLEGAGE